MSREIYLEDLLGRVVRTAAGRPVGRVEDVRAEPDGDEYLVREVVLSDLGIRARLFSMAAQLPTLKAIGLARRYRTRIIPWEWLDFSDPSRPQFREGQAREERERGEQAGG